MSWTLVTGGSKRLGAAICQKLAENKFDVLIHYHQSRKEAQTLAKQCRSYGVKAEIVFGDFSDLKTTKQFIVSCQKDFPQIINLINNVGPYFIGSSLEISPEKWREIFQLNLNTPHLLVNAFLKSIKKNKGNIINIGTAGINKQANTYNTAYNIAKSGLWLLTKSLAKELASSGVRVNMVSPGVMEMSEDMNDMLAKTPMKRAVMFDEVADVVLFLLDENRKSITGQNIEVAGGFAL